MRLAWPMLVSSCVLLSGCIEFQSSGARKGFTFFTTGAITPPMADGVTLSVVTDIKTKVKLGDDCLGSQSQLDTWVVVATATGHVYDIAAQGIPNNGSLLINARFLRSCTADDGTSWRHYAADLDKP